MFFGLPTSSLLIKLVFPTPPVTLPGKETPPPIPTDTEDDITYQLILFFIGVCPSTGTHWCEHLAHTFQYGHELQAHASGSII